MDDPGYDAQAVLDVIIGRVSAIAALLGADPSQPTEDDLTMIEAHIKEQRSKATLDEMHIGVLEKELAESTMKLEYQMHKERGVAATAVARAQEIAAESGSALVFSAPMWQGGGMTAPSQLDRIEAKLATVELEQRVHTGLLQALFAGEQLMSAQLDSLTTQVTANTDVEASAVTLLANISAQLTAAGTDQTKLTALAATLKTSGDALAAAVVANTPVATTP